jgi:predicted small lipoprotein YifL
MKKRILTLCVALAMVVSMTACGSKKNSESSENSSNANDSSTMSSTVDASKVVQPAAGGKFDTKVTYYAANSSKDTVLEIKNGKFEVVSTLVTERNVKGTVSEDGKLILDDKTELKYEIRDKYVDIYFDGVNAIEFEFGSANDLTTHMTRVRKEASKAKTTEVTTTSEETSKPETTTTPATQYPDDGGDDGVTYDPDAYHKPLPRVDVSGDKWTQTPTGWLNDIKGTTNYKYYNRNKWSEYKGENDPNFPNGDPAVEWAFMFTDVNQGFSTLVKASDSTPYTYEMFAEMLEYDVNSKHLDANDKTLVSRIKELAPARGSTGATFNSKEIESDSTNDLDKYIIKFEVSVEDDKGNTHYYNGSFKARDIADSGNDKYSYSYSNNKVEMYWTVYPYTFVGKGVINMRIIDKETNATYDRLFWAN